MHLIQNVAQIGFAIHAHLFDCRHDAANDALLGTCSRIRQAGAGVDVEAKLMINILHSTTYSGAAGSGSFALSTPSTAGNVLVAVVNCKNGNNQSPPLTITTNHAESLLFRIGSFEGTFTSSFIIGLVSTQTATTISFAHTAGAPSAVFTMIVYEISGNSLSLGNHTLSSCHFPATTSFSPSIAL